MNVGILREFFHEFQATAKRFPTVRRRPRDAAPLAPREHLDVQEVLGHRAVL